MTILSLYYDNSFKMRNMPNNTSDILNGIKAVFLDLSGVLYEGHRLIEGAVETVQWLRQQGYVLRFVTNTATQSHHMIFDELIALGFHLEESELFTAPQAAKNYILEHQLKPYCILHPNLMPEFTELQSDTPNCVLLGDAQDELNYSNLNKAFRLIEDGCPLIGIGKNKYFMSHDGLKLDAGVFIHALEWASGTEAIIMGKPDHHFFHEVVASTDFKPEECLMIGDDVIGDVKGAIDAGLKACLVQTGKFKESDLGSLPNNAFLITSVSHLVTE